MRPAGIHNLVIAGWTGRDTAAMEEHIAELEAIGIPRPSKTPCFYRGSRTLLTQDDAIQVIGNDSSGEVEYFLLSLDDGLWVGVGSDHTDRKVEAFNVAVSKQMCPKPISATVWPYAELCDHWDQLILKSEILIGGQGEPYQEGTVSAMRTPEDLIERYAGGSELPAGTLMYCGTLAVHGGVRPAEAFRMSLHDPVLDRTIKHGYEISSLPPEE